MFVHRSVRFCRWTVSIYMALMTPIAAAAQSAVGTGPLTSTLADVEPTTGVLRVGPVRVAPGITVRELGWDSNVFNEPEAAPPKEDYVVAATPDISAYTRLRFVR